MFSKVFAQQGGSDTSTMHWPSDGSSPPMASRRRTVLTIANRLGRRWAE